MRALPRVQGIAKWQKADVVKGDAAVKVNTLRKACFFGLVAFASTAFADDASHGTWTCALDAANSVPQDEPLHPNAHIMQDFATGSFVADLASGGAGGVFLYAHLHGIQNGHSGKASYYASALVEDDGGYYYMVTPPLHATVEGVADKTRRHIHCAGQFVPISGDLKKAIDNNVPVHLVFAGGRERTEIKGDLPNALKKPDVYNFLVGTLGGTDLLARLNAGKNPAEK